MFALQFWRHFAIWSEFPGTEEQGTPHRISVLGKSNEEISGFGAVRHTEALTEKWSSLAGGQRRRTE